MAPGPLLTVGPQIGSDTRLEEHSPHHETHSPHNSSASPKQRGVGMAESLAIGCALVVCVTAQLAQRVLDALGIQAWGLALVVVVAVVTGVRALARAPFTFPRSPRPAALALWAGAETKIALAALFVGAVVSLPLYALLRATPAWWLIAWLGFAAVTVVWQLASPFFLRAQAGPLVPPRPS